MPSELHNARKEELIKEIEEIRELIRNLTQKVRPLIDELEALKDYEILEVSDNWLESKESINALLDRAWDNGRGNRMASNIIEQHIQDISPDYVGYWQESGFYQVKNNDVRVISVDLGIDYGTGEEEIEDIAKSIRTLCSTVGDEGEDYYLPIMEQVSGEYHVLYPASYEVRTSNWGTEDVKYKGESLEDALEYIASTLPYDEDGK